jgi:hypothetical protein
MRRGLIGFVAVALLVASAAPAGAALTEVANWPMNETSGQMLDYATADGANNGDLVGVIDRSGTDYTFDSLGEYVRVPDAPSLDPGSQDISFTAVVNISQSPVTDFNVFRKGPGRSQHYKMEIKKTASGNKARCAFRGSNGVAAVQRFNIQPGTWYTITCTKTTNSISVQVGSRTRTKAATLGSIDNDSPVMLAQNEDGDDQLLGRMNMLKISIG